MGIHDAIGRLQQSVDYFAEDAKSEGMAVLADVDRLNHEIAASAKAGGRDLHELQTKVNELTTAVKRKNRAAASKAMADLKELESKLKK